MNKWGKSSYVVETRKQSQMEMVGNRKHDIRNKDFLRLTQWDSKNNCNNNNNNKIVIFLS